MQSFCKFRCFFKQQLALALQFGDSTGLVCRFAQTSPSQKSQNQTLRQITLGGWRALLLKKDSAQVDVSLTLGECFFESIGIPKTTGPRELQEAPVSLVLPLVQVDRSLTGTLVQLVCFIPEGEGFIQTLFFGAVSNPSASGR